MSASSTEITEMWNKSCPLIKLVASSIRVAETAGGVIKVTEFEHILNSFCVFRKSLAVQI
jgi:hypothetical protein